jgi:hypothetical protein
MASPQLKLVDGALSHASNFQVMAAALASHSSGLRSLCMADLREDIGKFEWNMLYLSIYAVILYYQILSIIEWV